MEMSENGVEHQATVDKGLKMKIRRKQPKAPETKAKMYSDDSCKSQKQAADVAADADSKTVEDDPSFSNAEGSSQKSQKRKRNNKNGKSRDNETDDKLNMDVESRVKSRELCHTSRNKDSAIANLEKLSNRKRLTVNLPEFGFDGKELLNTGENKDVPNSVGNKTMEQGGLTSFHGSDEQDLNCQMSDIADRESNHSDPYEFVTKVEDQHQTPVKKFKSEKMDCELSSSTAKATKCDVGTVTYSVGVMTDPDCLGPCEPGTSVILEGIVWSESNNGILVVNVTWRGKTYVGTLMDATKHHWASPRFREESPSAELDYRVTKTKRGTPVTDISEGRRLRKCRRTAATASSSGLASGNGKNMVTRQSPPINSEPNGRLRGRAMEQALEASSDVMTSSKRAKLDLEVNDEAFYKCMAPECSKKFKHISGLRYHQSHAHKKQSNIWTQKSEMAVINSELDKCKNLKKNDELLLKLPCADEQVHPPFSDELGNITATTCDFDPEAMEKESDETVGKAEGNNVSQMEQGKGNNNSDQILGSTGERETTPVQVTTVSDDSCAGLVASGDDNTVKQMLESIPEPGQHSTEENMDRQDEAGRGSGINQTKSYLIMPGVPSANSNAAAAAVKKMEACSGDALGDVMVSDFTDKPKSKIYDVEAEILDQSNVNSRPSSNEVFHKPILRTPDIVKHKVTQPPIDKTSPSGRLENGQSLTMLRPQNIGFKLSPSGVCNSEDKSPAYSDISDANDGAYSENEMRWRKAEKDLERMQKYGKPFVRKFEDYTGSNMSMNHPSTPKQSSLSVPEAVSASHNSAMPQSTVRKLNEGMEKSARDGETDQGRKAATSTPSFKHAAIGSKAVLPPNERQRTEKSNQLSDFNIEILQAQESGRIWMEMLQRSNLTAAGMMPAYGYGVDPLVHMQLMASNPEYRNHYERWYMGQQCYRQILQAESDRCSAGDKPVDMSAKSSTSTVNASSDLILPPSKSKTNLKPPSPPLCNGIEDGSTSEKQHSSLGSASVVNDLGKSSGNSHHEKNFTFRDKLLVPKQEPVRPRVSERDEKPLDLVHQHSNANKVKGKQLDSINFGGINNPIVVPKAKTPGSSSNTNVSSQQTTGHSHDYLKKSPSQMRYEPNFSPFPGFSNPSFNDSTLPTPSSSSTPVSASSANRSQVQNSKYPLGGHDKFIPGHSASVGPTRKSSQSTTPVSTKELSPTEKSDSRRQQSKADNFDFSAESSLQEKPSASSSASAHGSPLTLHHLHTHHHTHVVRQAYQLYGSYNGLMSPVPALVPPVVPVIPPTFIQK